MAKFTVTKALVVAALVCLAVDRSRAAENTEGDSTYDAARAKMKDVVSSIKQSASETYTRVREAEHTKKVESGLSDFFSGAFTKLKNAFGGPKISANADDRIKQEAIKAFDDYAATQEKRKKV